MKETQTIGTKHSGEWSLTLSACARLLSSKGGTAAALTVYRSSTRDRKLATSCISTRRSHRGQSRRECGETERERVTRADGSCVQRCGWKTDREKGSEREREKEIEEYRVRDQAWSRWCSDSPAKRCAYPPRTDASAHVPRCKAFIYTSLSQSTTGHGDDAGLVRGR